ncbi:hypothetical protein M5D96_012645, partial [Drosophila gunungcola]
IIEFNQKKEILCLDRTDTYSRVLPISEWIRIAGVPIAASKSKSKLIGTPLDQPNELFSLAGVMTIADRRSHG